MIISHDYKCIFIHIYKTGGGSIQKLMLKHLNGDMIDPAHIKAADACKGWLVDKAVENCWNQYYKFSIVRNPWDRLVSWYFNSRDKHKNSYNAFYHGAIKNTFTDFIMKVVPDEKTYNLDKAGWFWNQVDYLIAEPGSKDLDFIVDYIGRFEDLQGSFDHVCNHIVAEPIKMIHANKTPKRKKDYRTYYTEEMIDMVSQVYQRDIEYFNYEF